MSDFDDACLVQQCLAGDKVAFEMLVRRHEPKVRSVITTLLGRSADADDLVQETFVHAYNALARFKGKAQFSTWLLRIAINLCKNYRAAAWQRRVVVTDELTTLDEPPDELLAFIGEEASAEEHWWGKERRAIVRRTLEELPESQRVPILLHFFEDMSYAEIARILRCPESTVRARVTAGLEKLGERLSVAFGMTPVTKRRKNAKPRPERSRRGGESFAV